MTFVQQEAKTFFAQSLFMGWEGRDGMLCALYIFLLQIHTLVCENEHIACCFFGISEMYMSWCSFSEKTSS